MIPRSPLLYACPYCRAHNALTRSPPRKPAAALSRRLTTRATARPAARPAPPKLALRGMSIVTANSPILCTAKTVLRSAPLKTYATAAHDDELARRRHDSSANPTFSHNWPKARHPTPYEIFDQPKGSPYQKKRFYALAKLYHPDLHHNVPAHMRGLTPAVLIARYRLIVAANNVLSDPQRRKRYDRLGLGWEEHEGSPSYSAGYAGKTPAEQEKERQRAVWEKHNNWRTRPGSAANNATWEDWERWRQDNGFEAKDKQEEQFMSNGGFALVVLVLVFLGGWGQVTRAGSSGTNLVAAQYQNNQHISTTLRGQQTASAPLSRQDRVGSFLERRDGWYDIPKGRACPYPRSKQGLEASSSGCAQYQQKLCSFAHDSLRTMNFYPAITMPMLRLHPLNDAAMRSTLLSYNDACRVLTSYGRPCLELGRWSSRDAPWTTIARLGGSDSDVHFESSLMSPVQCSFRIIGLESIMLYDESRDCSTNIGDPSACHQITGPGGKPWAVPLLDPDPQIFQFINCCVLVGTGVNTIFEAGKDKHGMPLIFEIEWLFETFGTVTTPSLKYGHCYLKMCLSRLPRVVPKPIYPHCKQRKGAFEVWLSSDVALSPSLGSDLSSPDSNRIRYFTYGEPQVGFSSDVYTVVDVDSGQHMARKVIRDSNRVINQKPSAKWKLLVLHEVGMLRHAASKRTVDHLGHSYWKWGAELFTGLMHGTVEDLQITASTDDTCSTKLRWHMLDALDFLEARDIIHRDIKPANILFECHGKQNYRFRLCDFGLAEYADQPMIPRGTRIYAAPETRWTREDGLTCKADVWSLFVTILYSLRDTEFRALADDGAMRTRDDVYDYATDMRFDTNEFLWPMRGMAKFDPKWRSSPRQVMEQIRQSTSEPLSPDSVVQYRLT
ncbi:hsp40 co-chaperone [Ophiostoma piceae UAMH 11346]|uniref:Hsp40 co-chaperone n=1 Tax=Ophiostoma piceae (strain UAMH 11346) TaxID=1262450 RepID=S3C0G3_OPHP1|nr:hsp40 co-chaperone [Ophiostoma piceae UAMH 11346]